VSRWRSSKRERSARITSSGFGHSPAALGGYFALSDQIGKPRLGTRLRELISLAIAQCHGW